MTMSHGMQMAPRTTLLWWGIFVELLSIGWLLLEAGIGITEGIARWSFSLQVFGWESSIELLTGGIVLQRLWREWHHHVPTHAARIEQHAQGIAGWALLTLGVYVLLEGGQSLLGQQHAQVSSLGFVIAAAATLVCPTLWWLKRRLARQLHSAALAADAVATLTCGGVSAAVVVGIGLNAWQGWWWVDALAALGIGGAVLHEGMQTLRRWARKSGVELRFERSEE